MNAATEQLIIASANKLTAAGAVTTVAAGSAETVGITHFLGSYGTEIAAAGVMAGILFGLCGVLVQIVFSVRRDRRESAESQWRMGVDPDRRKREK